MEGIFEVKEGSLANANSLDIVKAAVNTLDSKKAKDIKVLKIEKKTIIADYFVLCFFTIECVNSCFYNIK